MDAQEKYTDLIQQGEELCDEAMTASQRGDYDQAIEMYNRAEDLFLSVRDQNWLNFLRHEKLRVLQSLDQAKDALELTDLIIEGYQETLNHNGLALTLIHKADLFIATEEPYKAISSLNLAKALINSKKLNDLKGYLHSSFAVAYNAVDDLASAIAALNKALVYYSPESYPNEYSWCLLQVGICYQKLYDYSSSEKHLLRAWEMYARLGDIEMRDKSLNYLKEIYSATNQMKKLSELGLR